MQKKLNGYLADLAVESHKLQSYHWYVKGPDFFQAHAKLEEYYDQVGEFVDEVAEAMLMSGMKPASTMKEFLETADIEEPKGGFITSEKAFADIAEDFGKLCESAKELKEQAEKDGNDIVAIKADEFIEFFSQAVWMLTQR